MAENFLIRDGEIDDARKINEILNWYIENTHFTFDVDLWSDAARAEWLADKFFSKANLNRPRHFLVVAEQDGDISGFCYNSAFRPKDAYASSCETTIYLNPHYKTPSLADRLYTQLFQLIQDTDLHRAYAGIAQPNPASVGFHCKHGFEQVGIFTDVGYKFGRFYDVYWYEKKLTPA